MNSFDTITCESLFDLKHTIAAKLFEGTVFPFEILPKIGEFLKELLNTLESKDYNVIEEDIYIAKTAKIADNVSITGPALICDGAELRPGAFIRGNVIVGKNAVVGNSCEIKNSILFDNVQVPHFNYVGDSILGYRSHMGAGAITSNVKSDKSLVVIKSGEKTLETGLKKVGAMLGDCVEIGCGSVLNPGTVIGKNSNVYPLSSVRGIIPAGSIYKKNNNIVKKESR